MLVDIAGRPAFPFWKGLGGVDEEGLGRGKRKGVGGCEHPQDVFLVHKPHAHLNGCHYC